MALYNFHRVLIVAATLFFAALAVYWFIPRSAPAGQADVYLGVASCVAALLGGVYFVYFNIRLRRLLAQGQVR